MTSLRHVPDRREPYRPTVTATITVRLPVEYGCAGLPLPGSEHGGLVPGLAGCHVVLDCGTAHRMSPYDAHVIAAALAGVASIDVSGGDPWGVLAIRDAITAAIERRTGAATA